MGNKYTNKRRIDIR